MRAVIIASILMPDDRAGVAGATEPTVVFSGAQKRNNLVTELLEVVSISEPGRAFTLQLTGRRLGLPHREAPGEGDCPHRPRRATGR